VSSVLNAGDRHKDPYELVKASELKLELSAKQLGWSNGACLAGCGKTSIRLAA